MLFRISLAVWYIATLFYAAGIYSALVSFFTSLVYVPILDSFLAILWFPSSLIAAWLFTWTRLPVPVLVIFSATSQATVFDTSRMEIHGLALASGPLLALGAVCVVIVSVALSKVRERSADANTWSQVLIYVAVLSYAFSLLEGITGTCTLSQDFEMDCRSGFVAALPVLVASTVLMATALAIRKLARSDGR